MFHVTWMNVVAPLQGPALKTQLDYAINILVQ